MTNAAHRRWFYSDWRKSLLYLISRKKASFDLADSLNFDNFAIDRRAESLLTSLGRSCRIREWTIGSKDCDWAML